MISQLEKSFSFIINLIIFIKTIEDMWNQDQILNLTEVKMENLWLLLKFKVIAIQFLKTLTFGITNNSLTAKFKLSQQMKLSKISKIRVQWNQIYFQNLLPLHVVWLPRVFSTILFKLGILRLKKVIKAKQSHKLLIKRISLGNLMLPINSKILEKVWVGRRINGGTWKMKISLSGWELPVFQTSESYMEAWLMSKQDTIILRLTTNSTSNHTMEKNTSSWVPRTLSVAKTTS